MKQKDFWDKEAEAPELERTRGKFLTHLFLRAINQGLKHLKERNQISMLKVDLWNEGIDLKRNILKYYQAERFRLYGTDVSFKVSKKALDITNKINITTSSIINLPYQKESFDIILDLSTLDHVSQTHVPTILKEYANTLKKEGIVVLIFDWWGPIWGLYLKYVNYRQGKTTTLGTWRYLHPLKFIKKNLNENFQILDEYCIDYTGWTWNRFTLPIWKQLPWKLYEKLLDLEYSKISKHLKFFAKQYVIICRKK